MSERSIHLPGKAGLVLLERDDCGVARITATTLEDSQFGLGYCHARDRGLQLLLVRILGRGQACEYLQDSEQMLELDRYFRRWNLSAEAIREEAELSARSRAMAGSYCEGANLYFGKSGLPWELRLLGCKFEPWTIADIGLTAKIAGLVALAQSQGDMERFIVECVQGGIGREKLEELFPGQLSGLDEELIRRVRLTERLVPESLKWASVLPRMLASNNWVVAGARTDSGKPFLCNDPHLELNRLPAVWYEAVLRWGKTNSSRYAIGATFPGLPGMAIGRTPELSWGVTHAFMDCMDSWIEECQDNKYRRDKEWLPFTVRKETIRRKKHPPLETTFFENHHGVLDGDPSAPGFYLATRWSGRDGGAGGLDATYDILIAKTVEEGRTALARVSNCSWNWVLADKTGNIGYQMSGKMPIRSPGMSGIVPLPGWDPGNDWRGFHPPEDLPRTFNPAEGIIVTANNDLNAMGKVGPINLCMASYRADRISAVLSRPGKRTLEEMKKLQLDFYSVQAEQFLKVIRPLLPEFKTSHYETVRLLESWDYIYSSSSKAAFLFEEFYRALICEVFGGHDCAFGLPVLDRVWNETCIFFDFYGNFDKVLLAENSLWFGKRSRDEIYRIVLEKILDIPPKAYGQTRRVRMRHLLFGGKLPLFLGFDREIEMPGNRATVHQGQIFRGGGREMSFAPSLRFLTDMATDEVQTTLAGGASDRFLSKWYANCVQDWIEGRYKILRNADDKATR
jgi:penicillin amidase